MIKKVFKCDFCGVESNGKWFHKIRNRDMCDNCHGKFKRICKSEDLLQNAVLYENEKRERLRLAKEKVELNSRIENLVIQVYEKEKELFDAKRDLYSIKNYFESVFKEENVLLDYEKAVISNIDFPKYRELARIVGRWNEQYKNRVD